MGMSAFRFKDAAIAHAHAEEEKVSHIDSQQDGEACGSMFGVETGECVCLCVYVCVRLIAMSCL